MEFSKRLKELRKINNLTQEELARALNISAASIGLYEQGRRNPDNNMLKQIASYFGVSVDFLIGHEQVFVPIDPQKLLAYNNKETEFTDFDYALHGETKNMTEEQKAAIMQMAKMLNATNKEKG